MLKTLVRNKVEELRAPLNIDSGNSECAIFTEGQGQIQMSETRQWDAILTPNSCFE